MAERPGRHERRQLDAGRLLARVLCVVFALIGALPLAAGLLVRAAPVRSWAAGETRRILAQELGVQATYRIEMELWPLRVALRDLRVPASDGGSPAFTAERVAVRPRIFSLLAGQLDVGDIEIDVPKSRLVLEGGKLTNVNYRLPKTNSGGGKLKRAPFTSLAISDAEIDLSLDGMRAVLTSLDLDVFGDVGPSFEVVLRVGRTQLARQRTAVSKQEVDGETKLVERAVYDDDVLCRLDLRARYEPGFVLVRRLLALGTVDGDEAIKSFGVCRTNAEPGANDLMLSVSELRAVLREKQQPILNGHVALRAPLSLVNRAVRTGPLQGWVDVNGALRWGPDKVLPEFRGTLTGAGIQIDVYRLAERLRADVDLAADAVLIPRLEMRFADGDVQLKNAKIEPLVPGVPLSVDAVESQGMQFTGLMRDLGVTPDTIVNWDLYKTTVSRIRGTISPLAIDADIAGQTRNFEVFDRSHRDTSRKHVIGVKSATLKGKIGVRPDAFEIYDTRTDFGASSVFVKLVSIGFSNQLKLKIAKGSRIDLANITPLLDIPMAGVTELSDIEMSGLASDPVLEGNVAIENFEFGGFPLGSLHSGKVRFRPLKLDLTDVRGTKGRSDFYVPSARLDFDTAASIVVDADVRSRRMDLRDFLAMWHFDKDPRFEPIKGEGEVKAQVHYALGGPEDVCDGGRLRVTGNAKFSQLDLFEEKYDSGHAQFDFDWDDQQASYLGMQIKVPSLTLYKGQGVLFGSLDVKHNAKLSGQFVGTGVPLARIDGIAPMVAGSEGQLSAVAEIGGTLDAMRVTAHARVSPLQIGAAKLPGSELGIELVPILRPLESVGTTKCGRPIPGPFDPTAYAADRSDGTFHVNGQLFGNQIRLHDLQITRQRAKRVKGNIDLNRLNVGAIAELAPAVALSDDKPSGTLSGKLEIVELPMRTPSRTKARFRLGELSLARKGLRVDVAASQEPFLVNDAALHVPRLALTVTSPGGQATTLSATGVVRDLGAAPQIDGRFALAPTDLSKFTSVLPRVERVSGTLSGELHVFGPLTSPRYRGAIVCSKGELNMRGLPAPLSELELGIQIDNDEVRIERGSARLGSGTLQIRGSAPLRGTELGAARAVITARELSFSGSEGIRSRINADLIATWDPSSAQGELPELGGVVTLRSFEYTRAVTMTADLATLAQRGRRTEIESYDPADDMIRFDLSVRAEQPLRIRNNLIEADLEVDNGGVQLAGTNQKFGLRGTLRLKQGGRIRLRRNEFEVRQGFVRFDDLTRISPIVDVTATTEYRRYSDALGGDAASGAPQASAATATSAAGGRWLITMRAHGDADKLKVDLTSEPALAQDDIFLLLTVGLTRAELDQARSASVGESVALEALGALTGADRAVTQAVPVIDEFRFGSAYSSRTGRTEPTVTIGKRLAERIRANVTSGLSESREIRSNVEWRLGSRVSVEGSYDNVNDISSSSLGNLGADIRWRLEFR